MSYSGYQPTGPPQYGIPVSYQPGQYTAANPYYALFQQPPVPKSPPAVPDSSPPDLSLCVNQSVASDAIQRLISAELVIAGFKGAHPLALKRLEREVTAFVEKLYNRAHECANLANRAGPIATDLLLACEDYGMSPNQLWKIRSSKKRKRVTGSIELVAPPPRSPPPEMLDSDDESNAVVPLIPQTLRGLPPHFPPLPPKHTYLRTPVSPPKKAAIPSLEKKLKTAGLVQHSLKNLLIATEETEGQEDAELLGHIVNWETSTVHPRKRWKIGTVE